MPPQSRGIGHHAANRSLSAPHIAAPAFDSTDPPDQAQLFGGDKEDVDSISSAEQDYASSSSSGDDEDLAESSAPPTTPNASQRPAITPRSQSYSSAAFAPPFYNRPPTPLPPSPSLTSLLRPLPFSAPLSYTTTPDSSDAEGSGSAATGLDPNAAAVAQAARIATVPRATPKIPTYEYYGFVVYLGSSLAFVVYLLWSYLPTPLLHQLGIYYYPNRWWSLAVPAWLVVAVVYIYVALAAWNTGVLTLPLSSLECLVDEKGSIAVVDATGRIVTEREKNVRQDKMHTGSAGSSGQAGAKGRNTGVLMDSGVSLDDLDWKHVWNEGTDAVMDIPIGGVCEVLYGS